jgi:hypothetical protein
MYKFVLTLFFLSANIAFAQDFTRIEKQQGVLSTIRQKLSRIQGVGATELVEILAKRKSKAS